MQQYEGNTYTSSTLRRAAESNVNHGSFVINDTFPFLVGSAKRAKNFDSDLVKELSFLFF